MDRAEASHLIQRRHHEYLRHVNNWKHLRDSVLGAQAYRTAIYGADPYGYPIFNLKRHRRERADPRDLGDLSGPLANAYFGAGYGSGVGAGLGTMDPSVDAYQNAGLDDFELRRSRTPVPCIVEDVVGKHRDRIYSGEVKRGGPKGLLDFWLDVDGRKSGIDAWMKFEVAPLFLALGFVDLLFENPKAPEGAEVRTRADQEAFGLGRCVASVIQPDNLLNWSLNPDGSYAWALVLEHLDDPETGEPRMQVRHWTPEEVSVFRIRTTSTILSAMPWGTALALADGTEEAGPPQRNPYGRVPIVRVFDTRLIGSSHSGKSAYEGVADRNREVYNLMSELMISDTNQAHPQLCLPEEYCQDGQKVPVGPNYVLPMKPHTNGEGYTSPKYLDPPKGASESLRTNIALHTVEAYRIACLDVPKGLESIAGRFADDSSGIAKAIDQEALNNFLRIRAEGLARVEDAIIDGWAMCARKPRGDAKVTYPAAFGAWQPQAQVGILAALEQTYEQAGRLPETEKHIFKTVARGALPNLQDADYAPIDAEIDAFIDERAELYAKQVEFQKSNPAALMDPAGAARAAAQHVPEGSGQPEAHRGNSVPALDDKAKPSAA